MNVSNLVRQSIVVAGLKRLKIPSAGWEEGGKGNLFIEKIA